MAAYNFRPCYVEHILSGRKRHTIRAEGKRRHARPGELVQLYTGMRTKACKKIMMDPRCTLVQPIEITKDWAILIDGYELDITEADRLAYADGFETWRDMMEFFNDRLPFKGKLIHWRPDAPPE